MVCRPQVVELWGEGPSAEEAGEAVKNFPLEKKQPFYAKEATWSVTVRNSSNNYSWAYKSQPPPPLPIH